MCQHFIDFQAMQQNANVISLGSCIHSGTAIWLLNIGSIARWGKGESLGCHGMFKLTNYQVIRYQVVFCSQETATISAQL